MTQQFFLYFVDVNFAVSVFGALKLESETNLFNCYLIVRLKTVIG